jgi:hypothetical protein
MMGDFRSQSAAPNLQHTSRLYYLDHPVKRQIVPGRSFHLWARDRPASVEDAFGRACVVEYTMPGSRLYRDAFRPPLRKPLRPRRGAADLPTPGRGKICAAGESCPLSDPPGNRRRRKHA